MYCSSVCRCKAHYEANRETISARQKAYHKANRETIAARQKAYYEANRETRLDKNKAFYEANREAILARQKARYEANPLTEDQMARRREQQRSRDSDRAISMMLLPTKKGPTL